MFALMFGNSMGNLEGLTETDDAIGYTAISRFWDQATKGLPGQWAEYRKDLCPDSHKPEYKGEAGYCDGAYEWNKAGITTKTQDCGKDDDWSFQKCGARMIDNPLKKYFKEHGVKGEKEMGEELDTKISIEGIVAFTAEYENEAEAWDSLNYANGFLFCCATYKLFLWLYCKLYAIPKSGSTVLEALATDKRNDFVVTYTVITATYIAYFIHQREWISDDQKDKSDPLISFVISLFIMYSWADLMIEHMTVLSEESSSDEFRAEIAGEIVKAVEGSDMICKDEDIKVYCSSERSTVEALLTVKNPDTPYKNVGRTIAKVKRALAGKPLERVHIGAQSGS
jgi:hypothetical protein